MNTSQKRRAGEADETDPPPEREKLEAVDRPYYENNFFDEVYKIPTVMCCDVCSYEYKHAAHHGLAFSFLPVFGGSVGEGEGKPRCC